MEENLSCRVETSFSKFLETCLIHSNLDDLFEYTLSYLLDMDPVRGVKISLFNNKNQLTPVAEGNRSGQIGLKKNRIRVQSWMIDSSVRHSTRRMEVPAPFRVTTIPLKTSEKLIGFLRIQLDYLQTRDLRFFSDLHLIGNYLSTKVKEIMLREEVADSNQQIQSLYSDNRENHRRITSLSKELYAICAISTKINQSLDIKKSLRKSIAKLMEVFKSSAVLVYLKHPGRSKPNLFTCYREDKDQKYGRELLQRIETIAVRDFFAGPRPEGDVIGPAAHHPKKIIFDYDEFKSMIVAPMRAKRKLVGALILLYETTETLNQDNLRLLCGIGDIMGMATENMNLYRQSQQKKKTAAFLVESISRFNEKLDLEKTLISVAEKGAEFIGKRCRVYLLTETRIPMIHLRKLRKRGEKCTESKTFRRIEPAQLKEFYEQMRRQRRPSIISNIARARKFKKSVRSFFSGQGVRSIVSVPLTLMGKSMGLLLFCAGGGKRAFDHLDLSVSEALGAAASVAIENSRAYTASVEMSDFLEKKINEKTTQMQKIQEKLENRVENRNDIVFRVNRRSRFIFVNKTMETLTGLGRDEICREGFNIEKIVAADDCGRVKSCFQIVLKGSLPMIKDLVYRHLNRRGEDHLISLTIYPEKDENGRIVGIEGVGRDITENKRLKAELAKAKELALLGEFSSAIAHQIRNPLGNILMGTKLLQRALGLENPNSTGLFDGKKNAKANLSKLKGEALIDIFKNLSEGIENINQVVTKLVEYTKTLKLSYSDQNLKIILEENLATFNGMIAETGTQLETCFEPDPPVLPVDAVLISQVFQNLIHNAIQAMGRGGRLIVSAGEYHEKPGYAIISFSDSGVGVEPAEDEKIFHPFYTTKDSGTGLGLSLAYRIVEAHQGKIWVCRNPCPHVQMSDKRTSDHPIRLDKGVTFHIILPSTGHANLDLRNRVN